MEDLFEGVIEGIGEIIVEGASAVVGLVTGDSSSSQHEEQKDEELKPKK